MPDTGGVLSGNAFPSLLRPYDSQESVQTLVSGINSRIGSGAYRMVIVQVYVHVKPESVSEFSLATIENARMSLQEPGIARFDVVQEQDDPTRFALVEVYRTPEAAAAHKETAHYAKWRDAVAGMMAEPRRSIKFNAIFPAAQDW